MKGKITLAIVLGLICFALVAVMFVQFKTVEKTDITEIETMRETELRTTLASWKTKYEEAEKQLEETKLKIQEYKDKETNEQETTELLEKELKEANLLIGKTEVIGKGVIVTLTASTEAQIDIYDLLQLLNELKLAGAEAISINDIRIVNTTDIAFIQDIFISIAGNRVNSPYIVKAIGDQTKLESGLMQKDSGYIDKIIKPMDKTATVERENNIIIPKYKGTITTKYIEKRKAGESKNSAIDFALGTSISSIVTSGLCFFAATIGVNIFATIEVIGSLCMLLSRGAIISMISVIFVLPSFLMLLDKIITKTTLTLRSKN